MSSRPRDPASARVTQAVGGRAHGGDYRQFRLTVLEGPAAGATFSSTGPRCSIGSHPSNDLVIDDPTVSSGTVVQELIPGYLLAGRLLRAAMVAVSKGGPPRTIEASNENATDER